MSAVVLVDTSILTNVLRVPSKCDQHVDVMTQLEDRINAGDQLMLPIATVLETGNHIGQNGDGASRRACASRFVDVVKQAAEESVPWTIVPLPETGDMVSWLDGFPDRAMRAVGIGDVSIIRAWEDACARFQGSRVTIWSLDQHLQGFDEMPRF